VELGAGLFRAVSREPGRGGGGSIQYLTELSISIKRKKKKSRERPSLNF
jgi:hypothetical protein